MRAYMIGEDRYYEVTEGCDYPSVTTILDAPEKPWLEAWRNRVGHDEAVKIAGEAATRGKRVHKLVAQMLRGHPVDMKQWQNLSDAKRNALQAFVRFKKDTGYKAIVVEKAVYSHTYLYAGTLDTYGRTGDGLGIICDWKPVLREDHDLQVIAYGMAFNEMFPSLPLDDMWVVELSQKDGNYNIQKTSKAILPIERRFAKFLEAYGIWRLKCRSYPMAVQE